MTRKMIITIAAWCGAIGWLGGFALSYLEGIEPRDFVQLALGLTLLALAVVWSIRR
jgi:hypothetical protein